MHSEASKAQLADISDWSDSLQADPALTPALRESYRITIFRFLPFCQSAGTTPKVAEARRFVEIAQLEQSPGPGRLQEWKDGLNWFFGRRRPSRSVTMTGGADVCAALPDTRAREKFQGTRRDLQGRRTSSRAFQKFLKAFVESPEHF